MKTLAALLAAAAMTALTTLPADAPAQAQPGVECAGIGVEGREMAARIPHTLKLVYAHPDGKYLGYVDTRIARAGEVVANVTCPGPWVLANLPAGSYEVTATFRGQTKSRRVTVSGNRRQEQVITF